MTKGAKMPSVAVSVLAFVFLLPVPGVRAEGFTGGGIAETLERVQEKCCPARDHGEYVSCAAHISNRAIRKHVLHPSRKVMILKHRCDEPSTTTTTKPSSTTTTTESTVTTTSSTSTTAPTTTTTTTTAESTSTTMASSTSTTAPTTTSTTASRVTTTSTTTTTMPGGTPTPREICGNCIDDDGNGHTDFEDPACCSESQTFTMVVSRGRLRPRGAVSRLRLKAMLARAGLAQVDPLRQDVFLQIRPVGGADLLCAKVPADKFMRMHGAFKFWDRKHLVASAKGLYDMTVPVRRDGSVRLRTLGRRTQMRTPTQGVLQVTVGFHDTASDAGNRCSTAFEPFRAGRRGALRAP